MDKEILNSKFIRVTFNEENRIYTSRYLPETENMTNRQWKELMIDLKAIIEQYQPLAIIDDNRNRLYDYSPDMQIWTLGLFVESWNRIGLKKYVQILPTAILGKLTSQQIKEFSVNDFEMKYKFKFVDDLQTAINWVTESEKT